MLGFPLAISATPIEHANLPLIHQHNALYDRNPADGNQNGEYWCAPVSAVSSLTWLATHYGRPQTIPNGPGGTPMTTDDFVRYLPRWIDTNDRTGTRNQQFVSGLWGYLRTVPYPWRMAVYASPTTVSPFDGPTFAEREPTVDDLYDEMRETDETGSPVILFYRREFAPGDVRYHAVVLQMLDNELDAFHRYPGKVMDPYVGALVDVGFIDEPGGGARIWANELWQDVYVGVAIAPLRAPEPASLSLACVVLLWTALMRRQKRRRDAAGTQP